MAGDDNKENNMNYNNVLNGHPFPDVVFENPDPTDNLAIIDVVDPHVQHIGQQNQQVVQHIPEEDLIRTQIVLSFLAEELSVEWQQQRHESRAVITEAVRKEKWMAEFGHTLSGPLIGNDDWEAANE